MLEYAALAASPCALPGGLILVFKHPVRERKFFTTKGTKNTKVKRNEDLYFIFLRFLGMIVNIL